MMKRFENTVSQPVMIYMLHVIFSLHKAFFFTLFYTDFLFLLKQKERGPVMSLSISRTPGGKHKLDDRLLEPKVWYKPAG